MEELYCGVTELLYVISLANPDFPAELIEILVYYLNKGNDLSEYAKVGITGKLQLGFIKAVLDMGLEVNIPDNFKYKHVDFAHGMESF